MFHYNHYMKKKKKKICEYSDNPSHPALVGCVFFMLTASLNVGKTPGTNLRKKSLY